MKALVAAVGLACCANAPAQSDDLELYAATLLNGMHGHPVGIEGRRLDRAEGAIAKRRDSVRAWLATRDGEAALAKVESDAIEAESGVYWIAPPSIEFELERLSRARKALRELERRKKAAEGQP